MKILGENIWKWCDLQGINFQNTQTAYIGPKKKHQIKKWVDPDSYPRRHTDSWKAHEKLLDTTNY